MPKTRIVIYRLHLLDTTAFSQALLNPIHERLSYFITYTCCFGLQVFYSDIHSSVNHMIFINNQPVLLLYPACSGLNPMIRMTFVLIFYPLIWYRKLIVWPISMTIIIFASTLHFLLLILVAKHYYEWYNFAHNWITKIIFYGFYFLCWLIWENSIKKEIKKNV